MKFPTLPTFFTLVFLSGCASSPTPPPRVNLPPPAPEQVQPEAETDETPAVPEDTSIRYRIGEQSVSLEDLKTGDFDKEQMVHISADSSVPFTRISEALRTVYSLGYLVRFDEGGADTP